MEIIYLIAFIFGILILTLFLHLSELKKVYNSHKYANMAKYTNNGNFNVAFNLSNIQTDDKKFYLRPVVDLDDKNIRNIVFINNVNSVIVAMDDKLIFELNITSYDNIDYYFITDNYKINGDQTIASNIVTNNFPKLFENSVDYYNVLNLKDLGYDSDVKIKTEEIVCLSFNGKTREMSIIINNSQQSEIFIKYKNKQEMISKIKNTPLLRHIMQWGVHGLADSRLTYLDEGATRNITEKKGEEDGNT